MNLTKLSTIVNWFCKLAKAESVESCGFNTDKRWLPNKKPISLNKETLKALEKAEKELPKGYSFLILGGLRFLEDQTKLVQEMEKQLKKSNPDNWEELLNKYTGGHKELKLKPDEISYMNHRSGNAIDITLMLNHKEVDMGLAKGDAAQTKQDTLGYYEKKGLSDKEKTIRDNRRILKEALKKAGFENYKDEWWHWGYKTK